MTTTQRKLAKWLAVKSPDTRVWCELLTEVPIKTNATLTLMPYSQDLGCYEAVRRLCCSNVITHGDELTHLGETLDLTLIDSWREIKKSYGKVDYVISVSAPCVTLEFILAYGWALSKHGVLLAAPDNFLDKNKTAAHLEPPVRYTIDTTGKKYWSWRSIYFWEKP